MKLSHIALPLLAACTRSDGGTLRKTVYVEVPVEQEGSSGDGGQPEVEEQPDLGEDPGYPGEGDTGSESEDTGLVDEIPYEDEVDIVEISDETCERLMETLVDWVENDNGIKSGPDSSSVWSEGEGLRLEMGMDYPRSPDDHFFVCVDHWSHDTFNQYGSTAFYHEVNPETGASYVDPKLWVQFPNLPRPRTDEYTELLSLQFGIINYSTGEMNWIGNVWSGEASVLPCWYGESLPFGITFCEGRL